MKNRIVKGIIVMVITSVIDSVLTNLGLSKKITSLNGIFPITYINAIFLVILSGFYLYGIYLFVSGIALAIKRKVNKKHF